MAKQEYDKTTLEVTKVATERLPTWALAVARMDLDQVMGSNFQKTKPVEYEKLQNILANYLVAGNSKPNRTSFTNSDTKQYSPFTNPATGKDFGELSG
jgi:hypothetical protein